MTTKPTASTWPESEREAMLAAVVEHLGPHALTHGKMSVFDAFCLGWKSRADLVAAREQEIIRATLQHIEECHGHLYQDIDPATILKGLK